MTLDKEKNCTCKSREIENMQAKVIELVISSSLKASENNLESALAWKKTAKLFFGGMMFFWLLSVTLAVGYFYLYDFNYEIVEEEITEVSEDIYQSMESVNNSTVEQNMNIGSE